MPGPSKDIARQCSPFLDQLIQREPGWMEQLQAGNRLLSDQPPEADSLTDEIAANGLDPGLRRFRNREMMRIIWRELNSVASLVQTMSDLSRLASLCLQAAIEAHQVPLESKHGVPRNQEGLRQPLVILGLGKLGGQELNLSSDIDIIFCFPSRGETDGRRRIANEQFFLHLARKVIGSLADVTEDGFCFRVDTRLRPFGDAGPLVCSFGAMEQYYQREGRDWERYALVKARPVAGDLAAGEELIASLTPFVYRRYIDFGAVEAMREMQGILQADGARKEREHDVKRGQGGIRDVEFLIQCLQLLRGGRDPALRTPRLLSALDHIEQVGLLDTTQTSNLRTHYRFLRRLENAIQALHDQQTHTMPSGQDLDRVRLAMNFDSSAELESALRNTRAGVLEVLHDCFPEPDDHESAFHWSEEAKGGMNASVLADFNQRLKRIALSQRATRRLDQFMPMLIERIQSQGTPPGAQADVLKLVAGICRRSVYLSLLVENPVALDRMLELFARSDWIAQTVIRYPALLDELIDPGLGKWLPAAEEMKDSASRILKAHESTESALEALNYMKLSYSLRIAVAELAQDDDSGRAQRRLSDLAEVLLDAVLGLSAKLLEAQHGSVPESGLGVIAYGTLGAREMSYHSDLDLAFLYQAGTASSNGRRPMEPGHYFTRLTRRMLSLLTMLTPAGRLYQVDTRLRPNGRAGLLVSSLAAFDKYQSSKAWTWELQALVRARAVCGSASVAKSFENIRATVLTRSRNPVEVRQQVRQMREKMRENMGVGLPAGDGLKQGFGGLVDIAFLVQAGVLESASQFPLLTSATGTCSLLSLLAGTGWLETGEAEVLSQTHEVLTAARHKSALSRSGREDTPDTGPSWEICARVLG